MTKKTLTPMTRQQMASVRMMLLQRQNGKCAICEKPISLQVVGNRSDYVVDHCHETGEVRGILHRSCNAAEGKITNAAGQWGAKSTAYKDVIPYLEKVLAYLKKSQDGYGTGFMYPDHKTPEQKAALAKKRAQKKRAEAYARRRAGTGKVR